MTEPARILTAVPAPPPGRDPRTRRWSISVVHNARLLRQGGWTVKEIVDYIEGKHGVRPSRTTIRSWTEPGFAEERRRSTLLAQTRLNNRRRQGIQGVAEPIRFDEELMLQLRVEDHLTFRAISKVAARVFGVKLSEGQVADRLHRLGVPKNPAKIRSAQLLNERKAA